MSRRLSLWGVDFTVGEAILTAALIPPFLYCLWLFIVTYLALFTPV